MEKGTFYIVEHEIGRWSFVGDVPNALRSGYGKPQTFASERDAQDAAFWNGYVGVETAALAY